MRQQRCGGGVHEDLPHYGCLLAHAALAHITAGGEAGMMRAQLHEALQTLQSFAEPGRLLELTEDKIPTMTSVTKVVFPANLNGVGEKKTRARGLRRSHFPRASFSGSHVPPLPNKQFYLASAMGSYKDEICLRPEFYYGNQMIIEGGHDVRYRPHHTYTGRHAFLAAMEASRAWTPTASDPSRLASNALAQLTAFWSDDKCARLMTILHRHSSISAKLHRACMSGHPSHDFTHLPPGAKNNKSAVTQKVDWDKAEPWGDDYRVSVNHCRSTLSKIADFYSKECLQPIYTKWLDSAFNPNVVMVNKSNGKDQVASRVVKIAIDHIKTFGYSQVLHKDKYFWTKEMDKRGILTQRLLPDMEGKDAQTCLKKIKQTFLTRDLLKLESLRQELLASSPPGSTIYDLKPAPTVLRKLRRWVNDLVSPLNRLTRPAEVHDEVSVSLAFALAKEMVAESVNIHLQSRQAQAASCSASEHLAHLLIGAGESHVLCESLGPAYKTSALVTEKGSGIIASAVCQPSHLLSWLQIDPDAAGFAATAYILEGRNDKPFRRKSGTTVSVADAAHKWHITMPKSTLANMPADRARHMFVA